MLPISTYFSVVWSVCLSSVTFMQLLKLFDGCHLAGTPVGQMTLSLAVSPQGQAKGKIGVQNCSQNMQLLQIAAKPSVPCCHLVNTNEKR